MADQVGYQLLAKDGSILASWGGIWGQNQSVPNVLILPNGDQVHCPSVGVSYEGCTLTPWLMDPPKPVEQPPTSDDRLAAIEALLVEKSVLVQSDIDAKTAEIAAEP